MNTTEKIDGCISIGKTDPIFCNDCNKKPRSDNCRAFRMRELRVMFEDNR